MAKKRTYREFKQGFFKPLNPAKCQNKAEIVYRSGLEAKLMMVLDKNPNVISWGSENVIIPYIKPIENKPARYFVDFFMKVKIGEEVKQFLVEVKPHSQTLKPTPSKKKKPSTILYENVQFAVNQAKWEAAKKYCIKKGWSFIVITELNIDKILGK